MFGSHILGPKAPTNKGDTACLARRRLRFRLLAIVTAWAVASALLPAQQPSGDLRQSTYDAAEKAFRERRLDAAAKGFSKLAELAPNTAEVHAKLGLIYHLQGRFRDAVPVFRKALELKPNLPNLNTLLAISLAELRQYKEALPGLEAGFENPADKDLKRLIGLELHRSYMGLNRGNDAASLAVQLSTLYPGDPEILFHLGRFYGEMATDNMRRLIDAAPDSTWAHQAVAEALESQGNYESAVIEYRKVLAEEPGRPGVHFSVGRSIQSSSGKAGSVEDAAAEFHKELRIDPSHALAAYEIGEIHRRRSEYEEARKFFEQALRHRPDFEHGRIALARVLRELNDPEQAKVHLEAALRLNPGNEVSHYQLALVYRALGDLTGAQRELQAFERLRSRPSQGRVQTQAPFEAQNVTPQRLDPREIRQ